MWRRWSTAPSRRSRPAKPPSTALPWSSRQADPGSSLALHELATNAGEYGALSRPEGRVELRWKEQDGELHLDWRESGGPRVVPPARRCFGNRLLEDGLFRDLDGHTHLEFAAASVCRSITAALVAKS
jgi:two-component sensor histidine kinase